MIYELYDIKVSRTKQEVYFYYQDSNGCYGTCKMSISDFCNVLNHTNSIRFGVLFTAESVKDIF